MKAKIKIEREVSRKAAHDLPDMSSEELSKTFEDRSIKEAVPTEEEIQEILRSVGKYTREDELNCGLRIFYLPGKGGGRIPEQGGAFHVYALRADAGRVHV